MQAVTNARRFLEGFVTTEARLAVSVIIAIAGVVVASILLPRGVRRVTEAAGRRLEAADEGSYLAAADDAITWSFPIVLVTRTIQLLIGFAVALSILAVWGNLAIARLAMRVLVDAIPHAIRLLLTIGLLAAGVVGTRVLETRIDTYAAESEHLNEHQQGVAYRVLQLTVFTAVGLAALTLWDINLGGLLIGAGFLGIVFGMAARQTLGALIAGFVLMFSRPFEIGDWVVIDDVEGIVTDITIVNTRLRNLDGEEVVMPNDAVSNGTIFNRTKRGRLRIRTDVGIDYDADIDHAQELAQSAMESVDLVAPGPKPQVVPKSFDDSAITLELRYWIKDPSAHKKWRARQAVIRRVKTAYDEAGVTIPFPQRTVGRRAQQSTSEPVETSSVDPSDVSD